MDTREGHASLRLFNAGMRALKNHDPASALPLLRASVDALSPDSGGLLAKRLYWLSVSLHKLGRMELSLKALASAQKLAPRGLARKAYCRASNGYGMSRSACAEHDDYRAFFAVHAERYLRTVAGNAFSSREEQEAVMTIIAQAWLRVKDGLLAGAATCEDKLAAFRSVRLAFPVLVAGGCARITAADFGSVPGGFRCPCGSGLPQSRCCGRVQAGSMSRAGSI